MVACYARGGGKELEVNGGLLLVKERDEGVEDIDNKTDDEVEQDEDSEMVGFVMGMVVMFVAWAIIVMVRL